MEHNATNTASGEAIQPKAGWVERTTRFLKEVRFEMDRVHWPTWKETRSATIVVIVAVLIAGFVLGFWDMIMRFIVSKLISG